MILTKLPTQKRITLSVQLAKMNSQLRFALIVSLVMFALTTSTENTASVSLTKRTPQAALVLLESSERAINQGSPSKAIAVSATDAQVLYSIDRATEDIVAHETQRKSSRRFRSFVPPQNVTAFAVGSEGNIYLADSVSNQVRIINPAGQPIRTVPMIHPIALGILGNGNMAVASSEGLHLLHLYGPNGSRLGSFGEMRSFDIKNQQQNRFLNKGKIVIGPDDTIYYVSTHAPIPTVRKFATDGQLLSEFVVGGAAIDYQVNVANGFLRQKQSSAVGGFDIITSAIVDPSTGHLWISMNGTSKTGVVYEYDSSGVKLREYAFVFKGSQGYSDIITGVKDIAVRDPWIYILAWDGRVFRFNLNNSARASQPDDGKQKSRRLVDSREGSLFAPRSASGINPLAGLQLPCPGAQPLTCVATCAPGSSPAAQDCAAEVTKRLQPDDTLNGGNCSNSPGPEPSCSASGNFCNSKTGTRGTISVSLVCNPVPPPPSAPPDGCDSSALQECLYLGEPYRWDDTTCQCVCDTRTGSGCGSPIIIDVAGNGFNLSGSDGGVLFDLNSDGFKEKLSWTTAEADDAWLVLDRNGNGVVDNGSELFGNFTPQPAPPAGEYNNGFLALTEYNKPINGGNGDGMIDHDDAIFSSLRLWQDMNHNGISESAELHTLPSLGVASIELEYKLSKKTDEHGNQFRYRAKVKDSKGTQLGRWAWDVFLVTQ